MGASTLGDLVPLLAVWVLAVMTPGPNFLATVASARRSRTLGLATALGVASGTSVWALAGVTGLALLFLAAGKLYLLIKLLGATYLVYLGLKLWWVELRAAFRHEPRIQATPAHGARNRDEKLSRAYVRGLFTNLSNPKTAAFFVSLFAATIPAQAPVWFAATACVSVVLISVCWYCLVAVFASLGCLDPLARRFGRAVRLAAGGLFVDFGLKLALGED